MEVTRNEERRNQCPSCCRNRCPDTSTRRMRMTSTRCLPSSPRMPPCTTRAKRMWVGQRFARGLRESEARVFTTARSMPEDLACPELFIAADVSTPEGVEAVEAAALERLGGIDVLVNNVGGSPTPAGGYAALTDDHWQEIL